MSVILLIPQGRKENDARFGENDHNVPSTQLTQLSYHYVGMRIITAILPLIYSR